MIEKQNIEWKLSWRDEYFEYISAFANADGGKIYIGINDKGEIIGISDYEKILVNLPNRIRDLVGVICEVNHLTDNNKHYIEINVNAYSVPISYKGKYYIRSGSTTQLLTGNSLNEFLLKKTGLNWDEVSEPTSSISDIDESAIEYFKNSANVSGRLTFIKQDNNYLNILKNLRLIDSDNKIKRAGLLLFAVDPLIFFTTAFIKIGRFGKTGADLLSQDVVEVNVFEQADITLEILDKKYFKKTISYDGNQRIETTEYPYGAIREILLNAIVHRIYQTTPITVRVYNDRLEIWNFGTLPKELSPEDLKKTHSSYPRNPLLAQIFYKGGLIESWGRGTIKILEECKKHGLPEPEIKEEGGGVLVILYKSKTSLDLLVTLGLNKRQMAAVDYVKENGFITNMIYQGETFASARTATRDLHELIELKVFKKIGIGKNTRYELF
ncbi:putative DNA binding domain-containing protein [Flavobacterium plurextorum]|uniref:ATP-binding protein n=1 Tax=Flavobacterium TaxID=237 RepID=UPI00214D71BE|nr:MULTISPECIES: ATP-binding protein [Flavobacterium]UUW08785.1 putative DNA binding domain-containing protein [Flavobacterium plurextorum]